LHININPEHLTNQAAKLRVKVAELEEMAVKLTAPNQCKMAAKKIANRKGKVAVFLGAGASKVFGWPLTSELLPSILLGLKANDLFEDDRINTSKENDADRQLLRRAIAALCPGLNIRNCFSQNYKVQLPLVTSLLTMIDFSLITGNSVISGFTSEDTRHARLLLERAIYEIVEHEIDALEPGYWPPREPTKLTFAFFKWLDSLRGNSKNVGVITSNYDLAVEQAWKFDRYSRDRIEESAIDLGFPWLWASNSTEKIISRPADPKRRLYKLHGSTNWLRCGLCDRIHINPKVDVAIYAFQRAVDDNNVCHCNHSKLEMQIVSPSFVREVRSPNLNSIWQSSLDWLRAADDWIIIGYSFPDEDINIRSLFARAFSSRKTKINITTIQHGTNEQTKMRYEAFFPAERLTYLTGGLETFIKSLI